MSTRISVIITCYNLEDYISRSIASCINQTLDERDYEVIVVDDGSQDKSKEFIKKFKGMVEFIDCSENHGVAHASNLGIQRATGDYIVRVDGDDFINKNFLKTVKEVLDYNDDIGFVYCDHIVVNEKLERKMELNTLDKILDHGAGILFRKKYLDILGCYNENYRVREDYDLVSRYFRNFDGYHLRLPYYRYFKREDSLSSDLLAREEEKNLILKLESSK